MHQKLSQIAFGLALLCLIGTTTVQAVNSDESVEITFDAKFETLESGHCKCERKGDEDGANDLIDPDNLEDESYKCGDCFQLVFVIDGRVVNGTMNMNSDQIFDIVKDWISRVVKQVMANSAHGKNKLMVIIQYADIPNVKLVVDLDFEDLDFKDLKTQIHQLKSMKDQEMKNEDSDKNLSNALERLKEFMRNDTNIDTSSQGLHDKWTNWNQQNSECKKFLITFTHGPIVGPSSKKAIEELKPHFDRTDVVTVNYRNIWEGDSELLASDNGVTYEYENYIKLLEESDEVANNICDPNGVDQTDGCSVELVFMVDGVFCVCQDDRIIFKEVRQFITRVVDEYRGSKSFRGKKSLYLGSGLKLGLNTFYRKDRQIQIDNLFDINGYNDSQTNSLDRFRAAVAKFDNSKSPFDTLQPVTDVDVVGNITLHELLMAAGDFSQYFTAPRNEKTTRILVVLKAVDLTTQDEDEGVDAMFKSLTTALDKKYNEDINIVTLPIKKSSDEESKEIHMLNAILDNPTDGVPSVLNEHSKSTQINEMKFTQVLSKIETCLDDLQVQKIVQKVRSEEWKCECPITITAQAAGSSCITGPVGDRGLEGDVGDIGPIGQTGPAGIPGIPGIAGRDGKHGLVGEQGPDGDKGRAGHTGRDGVAGRVGLPGDVGKTGPTGKSFFYAWENISKMVEENCQCNNACEARFSDWAGTHSNKEYLTGYISQVYNELPDAEILEKQETVLQALE